MKKKRFFVSVIAILLIIVMVGTMVAGYYHCGCSDRYFGSRWNFLPKP